MDHQLFQYFQCIIHSFPRGFLWYLCRTSFSMLGLYVIYCCFCFCFNNINIWRVLSSLHHEELITLAAFGMSLPHDLKPVCQVQHTQNILLEFSLEWGWVYMILKEVSQIYLLSFSIDNNIILHLLLSLMKFFTFPISILHLFSNLFLGNLHYLFKL